MVELFGVCTDILRPWKQLFVRLSLTVRPFLCRYRSRRFLCSDPHSGIVCRQVFFGKNASRGSLVLIAECYAWWRRLYSSRGLCWLNWLVGMSWREMLRDDCTLMRKWLSDVLTRFAFGVKWMNHLPNHWSLNFARTFIWYCGLCVGRGLW